VNSGSEGSQHLFGRHQLHFVSAEEQPSVLFEWITFAVGDVDDRLAADPCLVKLRLGRKVADRIVLSDRCLIQSSDSASHWRVTSVRANSSIVANSSRMRARSTSVVAARKARSGEPYACLVALL
jgi:hypothetical protein